MSFKLEYLFLVGGVAVSVTIIANTVQLAVCGGHHVDESVGRVLLQ